ncbi:MAG: squalene/phytoene synthase family protein [Alphaproteobacteria bacterium]|jgi:NADH dehydrogenase [ubiquinone] 1 alpha subcomplex assembly factor 6|nr:squalene/phytoene synthase family protein [Rhodospirillaceae bacterium]MBT6509205.1 squalene/phytoene synthase family protein [Rhodospirillaceae bacterium]MBT7613630.1 squalene/phytoene synthase family protein [Rhodospirillaceae bacterium]MBT7649163.1 squalene/phytoene synthase family protein [Rhodospirillaceae bacterium]MDG2481325.1 squalene/phytoene synthase family protein [Alphaproteobacteria bacterium]
MARTRAELSVCGTAVRENDPDRFFCTLFARQEEREALFALYTFNHELARVAESVSEPMLGQIRLQWWRESLDGIEAGTPRRHDTVDALAETWSQGFDRNLLESMVDAREADLSSDPPETLDQLIAYGRNTSGALMFQAASLIDQNAARHEEVCRDAGVAVALSGLLRSTVALGSNGRTVFPLEMLSKLRLDPRDILKGEHNDRVSRLTEEIAACALDHASRARRLGRKLAKPMVPALLPLAFATRDLATLRGNGYNPFDAALTRNSGGRQLAVLGRMLLGRF